MKQGVLFVLAELLTVVCLIWLAFFYFSDASRKPIVACAPLYYLVGTGARATTSAVQGLNKDINLSVPEQVTLACLRYTDRFVRSFAEVKR